MLDFLAGRLFHLFRFRVQQMNALLQQSPAFAQIGRWFRFEDQLNFLRDFVHAVGLGERQLRRRFERAVGYGPATLVRVQRFQHFLALAEQQPGAALSRLAAEAGYADQAHLTRECGRLTGLTPAALLTAGVWPAGEPRLTA